MKNVAFAPSHPHSCRYEHTCKAENTGDSVFLNFEKPQLKAPCPLQLTTDPCGWDLGMFELSSASSVQ